MGPVEESKSSERFSDIATERTVEEEKKEAQNRPRISQINITGKIKERVKSAKKD